MKKFLEKLGPYVGVAVLFGCVVGTFVKAVDAWDNTMTDYEVLSFLEKYPDSPKLNKIANERNLR